MRMKKMFPFLLLLGLVNFAASLETGYLSRLTDYIENPAVFEENQEEGHTRVVAYSTVEEALRMDWESSASQLDLNGTWKFFYSDTPEGLPEGFFREDFNDSNWNNIAVPGNWEMQGFGDPLFRNVTTPFKPKPPAVPNEYNPTGLYRRTFDLPTTWIDKQIFLRLEKVASASYVWVNGQPVGYNEGGHEPAEYNLTRYLKKGKNTLAVHVVKYSDGYYLENQDYWRLAGIFDKVWLFATPEVHIFDWYATSDLDENYRDARLAISVEVKNYTRTSGENYTLRATLYNSKQEQVQTFTSGKFAISPGSKQVVSLSGLVVNPGKWSAEFPDLYTLLFELINASGSTEEIISGRIGFKETAIHKQVFYLNGQPVKLNGINSHMQHPLLGHAMDMETIRKDFTLLKQFNINCVRTSHYPPVNEYLHLADEYGIYIVDETGNEAHATEYVSEWPEWEDMYRERARKMVLRDRNHPSILFWSAGNESGEGKNICAVIDEGKKHDPTRFWMYGGNAFAHPCEEIISPSYYTPFEMVTLVGMVPDSVDPRPSFMDEYLSVAGNGGGGLDDYWEMIRTYPRSMGGAIWDFVSPGLREQVRLLTDSSPNRIPVHIMGRARLSKGKSGKGIDLNGHDQWVEVYRADPVEMETEALTLTCWVFPRKLAGSAGTLITKGSHQYGIRQIGTDSLEFYVTTGKRHLARLRLPENWENNWHHVSAVYDGRYLLLQIDKTQSRRVPASGQVRNLPFPLNIGRNAEIHGQETSEYLYDAIIDDVGVFNQVIPVSQLAFPDSRLKGRAALWLDFESEQGSGEFFSIGIGARTYGSIWPDRTPQPEMWQIKKSGQPVTIRLIDAGKGMVEMENHHLFTNLNHYTCKWEITHNGICSDSGLLELSVPPMKKSVCTVPYDWQQNEIRTDSHLMIRLMLKDDLKWAERGHTVAWEQFELPGKDAGNRCVLDQTSVPSIHQAEGEWIISAAGFNYRFDKEKGILRSMVLSGREMIVRGPALNIWRPPLANELDEWGSVPSGVTRWGEGFGRMAATEWYTMGLDAMQQKVEWLKLQTTPSAVILSARTLYTLGRASGGFQSTYTYRIDGNGEMEIEHEITPWGEMPAWLPRMGSEWILPASMEQISWYGRGPQENYPDRKSGYPVGLYSTSVSGMVEPYLIPQDYGLRTDTRRVRLLDASGTGLEFSGSGVFNFSAWPYTSENLTRSLYPYQLKPGGMTTFNLDYATSGVGCTARSVFNAYRLLPGKYTFTTRVKPIANNK